MDILREHANIITQKAIQAVLPDNAVKAALENKDFPGRVILVAAGKAAWQMAKTAYECLGKRIHSGIVITKYHHAKGAIGNLTVCEAGHPIPDENGFAATQRAIDLVKALCETDTVIFLLSGGGSALFELPLIDGSELQDITDQLLACGADITEINTIRKRLSRVKGGRFAEICGPAQVYSIVLSDVIGDKLDVIASGPAYPDSSTRDQAVAIVTKYGLTLSEKALSCLEQETPKKLSNVTTVVSGSVKQLCAAAADACRELGYEPILLTDSLTCEAREAGAMLAQKLKEYDRSVALIAGGETVVKLTGTGLGGRNQEIALSAALGIAAIPGTAVFSVGSDGTDGPTDAAGGYVDYTTARKLEKRNLPIADVLRENDSYHALKAVGGLIITGPTGTNVNDVAVALLKR